MLPRFSLPRRASACALALLLAATLFSALPAAHAQPAQDAPQRALEEGKSARSVVGRPADSYGAAPTLAARFDVPPDGAAAGARPPVAEALAPAVNEDVIAMNGLRRRTTYYVVGSALLTGLAVTAAVLLTSGGNEGGDDDDGLADPPTRPN